MLKTFFSSTVIIPGEEAPSRGDRFRKFSQAIAQAVGSPFTFVAAIAIVVVWALAGPVFRYSESWQLDINTLGTIITFLMVFIIQNSQARDSKEIHLKLDELVRAVENARNTIINCSDLSDHELQQIQADLQSAAGGTPRADKHKGSQIIIRD